MMELFEKKIKTQIEKISPLADRMRPRTIEEVVGQSHLLGPGKFIKRLIEKKDLISIIIWGQPGTGKTTLANIIANEIGVNFVSFSAVLSGVKEIREVVKEAQDELRLRKRRTILFVDEIHRFNKAQQDAFLHYVEDGTITLIGATTENPSFEVNSPLLSRCKVLVLEQLTEEDLKIIIKMALEDKERGLGNLNVLLDENALHFLAEYSQGDARAALNGLEASCMITQPAQDGVRKVTLEAMQEAVQKVAILYDKAGEEHYNVISAFIKSMRGSDPDAALYWFARMIEAGEDPLFIARRMVIFASEDVGNADPNAIRVAIAAKDAVDFVGMPEGWIPLAQGVTYLATAPKSNASYLAYLEALADVKKKGALPVPLHIRNAPTGLMKELGYGKGYKYPHNYEGAQVEQDYLPDELKGKIYYKPTDRGFDKEIRERLKDRKK
ncbi:MAG: AAA family ATPase [Deltaproteobacteria bacterium GWC2_42_51]|nr:MAG: AAA family ATPase [Deltaproteobacteria bacterium GWC2_42_51]OGP37814.1 MAG: AAA family ATPase [Deltaproteobacteria bacterium GWD2_42_10]OGP46544.1 MAG: AAA family ATPase [Deltaproteobacteria bacterium GWF2_42_12]OGQ29391.1 MAG: AAA family ATPase [Deltaproteobacteria bacterium RIFCSPHIGHO2_02_FULL_42_44]OGQ36114.1 MAG: AAA family ATPase [Deltaproteobacteria bacterium RIFCSPLOWO2_02_FULL_42_39]OGQ66977.1 MAG: AAA family ATPase [Deltaproteobacteria bacterium RIFCSPLOWO2_12_FULL_42_16]OGQ